MHNSDVPLAEFIRKQHFYNSFTSFDAAVKIPNEILAEEIRRDLNHFDMVFGFVEKT